MSVTSVNYQENGTTTTNGKIVEFSSTINGTVEWPISKNSSRKSPTTEDIDKYFDGKNLSKTMINGYLPQQLTTAKEI
uniref:Uncharacterized protein n=1 Tax=Panagrolaimus sp. JU765 TaxID=591449 RepID=A0AC34QZ71_9BILA